MIDISVTNGTLREVQLPHFVCVGKAYLTADPVISPCSLNLYKLFKPFSKTLLLKPTLLFTDSVSSSGDAVKALHVKDGTVSLERCELSGSHAKILNPTFSFFAIVVDAQQYHNMKFQCETLIYRNRKASLNLHVYLIVKDQKLKKVKSNYKLYAPYDRLLYVF